eukprot:8233504-Pyramimonas_sp.AAC.1
MAADLDCVPLRQLLALVDRARDWADLAFPRALLASRLSFIQWATKPETVRRRSSRQASRHQVHDGPELEGRLGGPPHRLFP